MSYNVRNNPVVKHYDVGRGGNRVNKIVIHHAATTDFDGIARTFNGDREASAHWAVGNNNNVDRLVDESNTAWHCGNYPANQTSVGIENLNASGAPNWDIADSTFNTLVELVRDVAARHGLGKLVPGQNLFGHQNFMATACPGKLYGRLQELADRVNGGTSSATPTQPTGGKKSNEQVASEVMAGSWGNGDDRRARLQSAGYDYGTIQGIINARLNISPVAPRKSNDVIAAEVLAGAWGNNPTRQQRLVAAGYDYAAVQAAVNARLGGNAQPAQPARLSNEQIADQVIAGSWGNGPDRIAKLQAAGYDYNAVQAAVNVKLGMGASAPARKSNEQVANEIIAGQGGWGNGDVRRSKLQSAGYDYNAIQAIINRKLGF